MKIDLKKHQESGKVVGAVVVGVSLFATMTSLAIGTTAMFLYLTAWIIASPVLYLIHKAKGGGSFITITEIKAQQKPVPPALTATELEHNATRHRK